MSPAFKRTPSTQLAQAATDITFVATLSTDLFDGKQKRVTMFHLLAHYESAVTSSYTILNAMADSVFGTKKEEEKSRFVYGQDLHLFAGQVFGFKLAGVRLSTPSMVGMGRLVLRPWTSFALTPTPETLEAQDDPNLATFLERPPLLRKTEEISFDGHHTDF